MIRRGPVAIVLSALLATASISPALGAASDEPVIEDGIIIESFDGTPIVGTLMLPGDASAASPVPVILQTHGWGGTRQVAPGGMTEELLDRDYAIFTWDSRGFGDSGGEANVDSIEFEVKDAQAIIDYLATRAEIEKDGPGDPRMGWIGGSYAGGIQLNTAGIDHRPDALVPEISWSYLVEDLYPNGVLKKTWDQLLYGAGAATASTGGLDSPAGPQVGVYASQIHQAEVVGTATGTFTDDLLQWFAEKSTILRTPQITTPTMIVQGTVDTLFPLEDGFNNYLALVKKGTPAKLLTFCGGHTLALVSEELGPNCPGGSTGRPDGGDDAGSIKQERTIAWLDRWVKGLNVPTGPKVEWQGQDGYYYGAPKFPVPGTKWVRSEPLSTTLVGPGLAGGDGLGDGNPAPDYELGVFAQRSDILTTPKTVSLVGVPKVEIVGSVTGVEGVVFFELVDVAPDGSMVTIDDQTMPLRLGMGDFDQTVALHGVSWLLEAGHTLQLEVTTGSFQYDINRMGPYGIDIEATTLVPVAPAPRTRAA